MNSPEDDYSSDNSKTKMNSQNVVNSIKE